MRTVFLFALMTILSVSFANAQERLSEKELIQAFLRCPEIVSAQRELAGRAEPDTPRILLYNSICGNAGCQYSALVAQRFERRKADPETVHILGFVYVGSKGRIIRVERVELIPSKELRRLEESGRKR